MDGSSASVLGCLEVGGTVLSWECEESVSELGEEMVSAGDFVEETTEMGRLAKADSEIALIAELSRGWTEVLSMTVASGIANGCPLRV